MATKRGVIKDKAYQSIGKPIDTNRINDAQMKANSRQFAAHNTNQKQKIGTALKRVSDDQWQTAFRNESKRRSGGGKRGTDTTK